MNMSYCRFENTLSDLRDCLDAIKEEGLDTLETRSERVAAEDLVSTAKRFIKAYEEAVRRTEDEDEDEDEMNQ